MKCELCNQEVESVGRTTKHYEGKERELGFQSGIDKAIEVVEKAFENSWVVQDTLDTLESLKEAK